MSQYGNYYSEWSLGPRIIALQRLQREIDDLELGMDALTIKGWGNTSIEFEDGDTYETNYTRIKENQQKIKEIIESL